MNEHYIVVADGARARIFSYRQHLPQSPGGPESALVEIADLANTEIEAEGKNVWSDNSSGRNRSAGGGGAHGYDDHRRGHQDELGHRFAKQIAAEISGPVDRHEVGTLTLVAEKQMLGYMREVVGKMAKTGVEIKELAKDLTKSTPHELYAYLAEKGEFEVRS